LESFSWLSLLRICEAGPNTLHGAVQQKTYSVTFTHPVVTLRRPLDCCGYRTQDVSVVSIVQQPHHSTAIQLGPAFTCLASAYVCCMCCC
jgi:hypothetical protein